MFKNIEIKCQGFEFDTTDESEANFFSGVTQTAVTDEIDLKDFLLKQDLKLKRNFNTTDTGYDGRNNLFFESSNIDLKLTDLESTSMSTFFKLYDDTRFIKYKVQIYNSNALVWQGIVYQEGIKEEFTNDNNNKVLSVLCLGWESEFKEYFSSKPLPALDFRWQGFIETYYTQAGGTAGWEMQKAIYWSYFMDVITNSDVIVQGDLDTWRISYKGWLHNHPSSERFNWFVKSGYDRMWTEESVYGFIEKTCNAMGWTFFWSVGDVNTYNLIIKKRGNASGLSTYEIAYEDFIRWEVTKHPNIVTYDYVVILDGDFLGGNLGFPEGYSIPEIGADHRGARLAIISDKLNIDNNSNHWNSITGTAGGEDYTLNRSQGYAFSKYPGEYGDNINITIHTRGSTVANSTLKVHSLPKSKILFIDGGDTGKYYTGCYMNNTSSFAWETGLDWLPMSHPMLLFKGNYGSMMMYSTGNTLTNWQSYSRTDEFKNNFRPFLNSRINRSVTIRVKDLITDPLQYITVTGYNEEPFSAGNKWAIISMETDLLNDITELQLSAE